MNPARRVAAAAPITAAAVLTLAYLRDWPLALTLVLVLVCLVAGLLGLAFGGYGRRR